jgi:hypothetical protein
MRVMVKRNLEFKLPEPPDLEQLDLFRPRENTTPCGRCAHSTFNHSNERGRFVYCWEWMNIQPEKHVVIECGHAVAAERIAVRRAA